LALLALGVTGFASAWWTAELKVTGTVTTGTFGLEWSPLKYTITGDDKKIITWPGTDPVYLTDFKEDTKHPQTLAIELENVYPCTDLEIVGDIHYYGTVPGIIKSIDFGGKLDAVVLTDFPEWMFNEIKITDISKELTDQNAKLIVGSIWKLPHTTLIENALEDIGPELIGLQWHYCYHIDFEIYIHWIEDGMSFTDMWGTPWICTGMEVPQGATLTFTLTINVVQYNMPP
jgi:hypothetical protein